MSTEADCICAACGAARTRAEVLCAAGPEGASWYCRDGQACRDQRATR